MKPFSVSADGWLEGVVSHRECTHFDDREQCAAPDTVVLHNISLPPYEFHTHAVEEFFTGRLDTTHPALCSLAGVRVSSHFFITRKGVVHQFVSTEKRAWHAGVSRLFDRERVNDFSIGIELEGSDFVPFAEEQYIALTELLRVLCRAYPVRYVVGHSDIAPDRKTDPGPYFAWERVAALNLKGVQLPGAAAALCLSRLKAVDPDIAIV